VVSFVIQEETIWQAAFGFFLNDRNGKSNKVNTSKGNAGRAPNLILSFLSLQPVQIRECKQEISVIS
jgi:hypothetical protein